MRTKRPVFVYQIQAEGTLDQVVQDLLMEYCKMKSPIGKARAAAPTTRQAHDGLLLFG